MTSKRDSKTRPAGRSFFSSRQSMSCARFVTLANQKANRKLIIIKEKILENSQNMKNVYGTRSACQSPRVSLRLPLGFTNRVALALSAVQLGAANTSDLFCSTWNWVWEAYQRHHLRKWVPLVWQSQHRATPCGVFLVACTLE